MATITINFDTSIESLDEVLQKLTQHPASVLQAGTLAGPDNYHNDTGTFDPLANEPSGLNLRSVPAGADGETDAAPTIEQDVNSAIAEFTKVEVDVDADDLIWDERIHSGSKVKNADGRWKKRKGVDKDLITE